MERARITHWSRQPQQSTADILRVTRLRVRMRMIPLPTTTTGQRKALKKNFYPPYLLKS